MSILTSRRNQERRRRSPPAAGRAPTLLDSFNYAFEGIIHVLRTQRNLRIHFLVAIAVIAAATTSFDPNAKLAKDIAAGAVLISSAVAVAIGYLVFAHAAAHRSARVLDRIRDAPA